MSRYTRRQNRRDARRRAQQRQRRKQRAAIQRNRDARVNDRDRDPRPNENSRPRTQRPGSRPNENSRPVVANEMSRPGTASSMVSGGIQTLTQLGNQYQDNPMIGGLVAGTFADIGRTQANTGLAIQYNNAMYESMGNYQANLASGRVTPPRSWLRRLTSLEA